MSLSIRRVMFQHVPAVRQVSLEVIDYEEYVEVEEERGEAGELLSTTPIEETRTAFLHLRLPNGKMVRAEIPPENLDDVLAVMFPEDFDPNSEWNRSLRTPLTVRD